MFKIKNYTTHKIKKNTKTSGDFNNYTKRKQLK